MNRWSFIFIALLCLAACNRNPDTGSCRYCDCCSTPPLVDSVLLTTSCDTGAASPQYGRVYIPNIFIIYDPEMKNHRWYIGGECIDIIEQIKISTDNGVHTFMMQNVKANLWNLGWDGRYPFGFMEGSFNYEVSVRFVDGQKKTYTGKACSYVCGREDFPIEKLEKDCFFPAQNDNGRINPAFPKPSPGCFE